ncbi:MAG: HAD-IC family P-type ATPase [Candidatus Komeilibacteria bacterium]|nr:HAD-IC family P-type ATPase [Candidatus Komeilibacteria bacterium]
MPVKTKKIDGIKTAGSRHKHWSNLALPEIIKKLYTSEQGLTSEQAALRLKEFGYNQLPEERRAGPFLLFLRQFKSSLIYILLAAALVSFWMSDSIDGWVILAAVFFNVIIGFFQEYKAQNALAALKKVINHHALVIRDGRERQITAREVVPGDIVILYPGYKVPADGRLFAAEYLKANEAPLSGESEPSEKTSQALAGEAVLMDQHNMVFMGSIITEGHGKFFVTAIGTNTELGKIASEVRSAKEVRTPLQEKLARFSREVGITVFGLCFAILLIGLYLDHSFIETFTTAVAIAVATIPEGLVVAVTAILAVGMQRILKKGSLVRQLVAAETLGSTSVICVDKTGTITLGEMRVVRLFTASHDIEVAAAKGLPELLTLHRIGLYCSNALLAANEEAGLAGQALGTPTERALLLAAIDAGVAEKNTFSGRTRFDEIPFDSTKKFMSTLNRWTDKQNIIYYKGAPEKILRMCDFYQVGRSTLVLSEKKRREFIKQYEKFSRQGLRVLAGALKATSIETSSFGELPDYNTNAIFVGFWGMKDPIRPEVKATIKLTQQAGIRTIMLTGDNKHTAAAIAREAGLDPSAGKILEDKDLVALSDVQLARAVKTVQVFARVTPHDKLRIVTALQKNGDVVAMTGDGVNDAPALQRADIGVALGSGTDVAKETADIVLLDNNFATIISAVHEGRVIFDNIKKVTLYLLSDALSAMLMVVFGWVMNWPLVLLPAQILWINLVADGLPTLSLTQEPEEPEIMFEPPHDKQSPILDWERKFLIVFIGLATAATALILFYLIWKTTQDVARARTVAFATLGIGSFLYVFSARSQRHTIFERSVAENKWLLAAVAGSFIIQIAGIQMPFFQKFLQTVSLGMGEWLLILIACGWLIVVIELVKYLFIVKRKDAVLPLAAALK